MKNVYLFIIILVFQAVFSIQGSSQDSKRFKTLFREAEYDVIKADYQNAIATYNELLLMEPDNANIHFLLAYSILNSGGKRDEALKHLEKAVFHINKNYREGSYLEKGAPVLIHYLMGKAYLLNGNFDMAIEAFNSYKDELDFASFAEIEYVKRQINSCKLGKIMVQNPVPVEFVSMGKYTDLERPGGHPVVSGNDSVLIFTLEEWEGKSIAWIKRKDSSWTKPWYFTDDLEMTGDYSPVSLSYNGKQLYLVRKDDMTSNIYVSNDLGSNWSKAEPLGKNINTKYLETHASISSDGKTLYFTSNRKNGWGGMDLYKSELDEDGEWGEAMNLGFGINTYYDEETPFIAQNDSVLYFSSDGLETMGGFDIFLSRIDADGFFSVPHNLGYPISTPDDDLFYNPGWNGTRSYDARKMENDSIESVIYAVVFGAPKPQPDNIQLTEALVEEDEVEDRGGLNVKRIEEGAVLQQAQDTTKELIESQQEALVSADVEEEITPDLAVEQTVVNTKTGEEHPVDEFYYIMNSILFAYNNDSLDENAMKEVDRIYMMMHNYQGIKIELLGHADSKGRADYNIELSRKRAESVQSYLLKKGITEDRIKVIAMGENDPVAINQYADGSDAPEGRSLNRNVSIRIDNKGANKVEMREIFVPARLRPGKYTIQVMALKTPVELSYFNNIGSVRQFNGNDGFFRYVHGRYQTYKEARTELSGIKQKGYETAFVRPMTYYEGIAAE